MGDLSGFGIMAGMAAGELLGLHVAGGTLPDYAPAFLLRRYEDPEYAECLPTGMQHPGNCNEQIEKTDFLKSSRGVLR